MEQKEAKSAFKATDLVNSFHWMFHKMSYTIHPSDVAGEAQGKSSNVSWAARQVSKDYAQELKQEVVLTVMDGRSL